MEGGGRSAEERRAAADARARAREGVDREGGGEDPSDAAWTRRERPEMSRYQSGGDVYARRRALAGGAVAGVVIILFLLLVGC